MEPFSSEYSLAEALYVSPLTALSRLYNSLGMKKFCRRWVPHQLTDGLRQAKVTKCGKLLRSLEAMQRTHFRHMLTGNQGRFYVEYQHALQWSVPRDEVPQMVNPAIGTAKFMSMAIWGINSFHLLDLMLSQRISSAQYFVKHVMAPVVQTVLPKGRRRYTTGLNDHLDSCRVHFSKVTEQFVIENQLLHVPPDSPNLAFSDFWRFRRIKNGLTGRSFAEPEGLLEGVREFLARIPAAELTAVSEG
jgi:hypothetical protein